MPNQKSYNLDKEAFAFAAIPAALWFAFNMLSAAGDAYSSAKYGKKGIKDIFAGNLRGGAGNIGKSALNAALTGLSVAFGGGALKWAGKSLKGLGQGSKAFKAYRAARTAGRPALAAYKNYKPATSMFTRLPGRLNTAGNYLTKLPGVKQINTVSGKYPLTSLGTSSGGGYLLNKVSPEEKYPLTSLGTSVGGYLLNKVSPEETALGAGLGIADIRANNPYYLRKSVGEKRGITFTPEQIAIINDFRRRR